MTKKKPNIKPNIDLNKNKGGLKPFIILVIVSIMIAIALPSIKESQKFVDTEV
jgi:hypothetical protein